MFQPEPVRVFHRQFSPSVLHRPCALHASDRAQSASLAATHPNSRAEHSPLSLQASDFLHEASVTTHLPPRATQ